MKVIAKVLRFCQELLTAVSEPIVIVLQALQKLLRGVLNVLVGAPAEAVDSMGQRVFERAGSVDSSLDARAEAKKEQVIKEKLYAALERLYYTDSFLTRRRSIRRWKNFWIVLIEMVSFTTTYRGLNQVLSALHFAVPLLLAVVIQTSLGYLAAVASGSGSTSKQKGLLIVVLFISVAFSFVGVTESILPYSSYAQVQYSEFCRAYGTAKERGELAVDAGNNPMAEISGQYAKVDQLLADAGRRCNDEMLEKAREELADYESRTVYVVVDQRDPMYQDADGHWVRGNGGSRIEYVPDPDAKVLIEAAQAKIEFLEEQREEVAEIQALLQGKAEWTVVTAIVEKQMESDDTLPEFTETSHVVQLLQEKCRALADKMQSPITIHLNLEEILRDYQRFDRLSEVEDIPAFKEIHDAWKETQVQPANTGVELLDVTLAVITVNNPSLLKEQLDQTVENSYGTLLSALDSIGAEAAAVSLTQAHQAYHMELPMLYAFNALRPNGETFGIAVLAAVVAVINDGLAVLIGLWMEQRCINWGSRRTIGINDLMPHLYPHFRAVIMPILRRRVGWNFDFEEARDGFVGILEDYLSRFELKPLLIREGFTRCGRLAGSGDPDFEKFCAFLLTWGLAKPIRPEDAETLDLADMDDPNARYILLSSRAEGWLIDLLGNAAELGYNELVYSV